MLNTLYYVMKGYYDDPLRNDYVSLFFMHSLMLLLALIFH